MSLSGIWLIKICVRQEPLCHFACWVGMPLVQAKLLGTHGVSTNLELRTFVCFAVEHTGTHSNMCHMHVQKKYKDMHAKPRRNGETRLQFLRKSLYVMWTAALSDSVQLIFNHNDVNIFR